MNRRAWFVTGTDTDVGKTFVSCALLHAWQRKGIRACGFKPVAAGVDASGVNADALALLHESTLPVQLEDINPVSLPDAIAPHIAAQRIGFEISIPQLCAGFEKLLEQSDRMLVEGAGGFLVPLDDQHDFADLAVALRLPVILVVGMRLGCINHALLTRDAILSRGLTLAGWVANTLDPDMPALTENIESLRLRLPAPCLGILPRLDNFTTAADMLELPE